MGSGAPDGTDEVEIALDNVGLATSDLQEDLKGLSEDIEALIVVLNAKVATEDTVKLRGLPIPDVTQDILPHNSKNTILNTFQTIHTVTAGKTMYVTSVVFNNWHNATNEMNLSPFGDTIFHMAPANSSIVYVFPTPLEFAATTAIQIRSVTSLNANFSLQGWEE